MRRSWRRRRRRCRSVCPPRPTPHLSLPPPSHTSLTLLLLLPSQEAIESANRAQSEKSLGKLEETLTRVLSEVAERERAEAAAAERAEKARLAKERKEAREAAKAVAAAEAEAAAEAAAAEAAAAEEEAAKPAAERAFNIGSKWLGSVWESAEDLTKGLDPAEAARAAEEEAAATAEELAAKRAEEEERRRARRMKKLAPSAEEFRVRLVRGLSAPEMAPEEMAGVAEADGEASDGDGAAAGGTAAAAAEAARLAAAVAGRERSRLVGTTILVDATHPDFEARWRKSRQGAPKVDERLCGYLATIVSSHYRERAYQAASKQRVDYAQAYEEMIGTYCRLEDALRAVLPALLREMAEEHKVEGGGGNPSEARGVPSGEVQPPWGI